MTTNEVLQYRLDDLAVKVEELRADVKMVDQSLCKLRLEQYQIEKLETSVEKTNQAVMAIGSKLDSLRKELEANEVISNSRKVGLLVKIILGAVFAALVGLVVIKN